MTNVSLSWTPNSEQQQKIETVARMVALCSPETAWRAWEDVAMEDPDHVRADDRTPKDVVDRIGEHPDAQLSEEVIDVATNTGSWKTAANRVVRDVQGNHVLGVAWTFEDAGVVLVEQTAKSGKCHLYEAVSRGLCDPDFRSVELRMSRSAGSDDAIACGTCAELVEDGNLGGDGTEMYWSPE